MHYVNWLIMKKKKKLQLKLWFSMTQPLGSDVALKPTSILFISCTIFIPDFRFSVYHNPLQILHHGNLVNITICNLLHLCSKGLALPRFPPWNAWVWIRHDATRVKYIKKNESKKHWDRVERVLERFVVGNATFEALGVFNKTENNSDLWCVLEKISEKLGEGCPPQWSVIWLHTRHKVRTMLVVKYRRFDGTGYEVFDGTWRRRKGRRRWRIAVFQHQPYKHEDLEQSQLAQANSTCGDHKPCKVSSALALSLAAVAAP